MCGQPPTPKNFIGGKEKGGPEEERRERRKKKRKEKKEEEEEGKEMSPLSAGLTPPLHICVYIIITRLS